MGLKTQLYNSCYKSVRVGVWCRPILKTSIVSLACSQGNGGRVHGNHHGGPEGSNQRAGEADTPRRPIQMSHLHGEHSVYMSAVCTSSFSGSVVALSEGSISICRTACSTINM